MRISDWSSDVCSSDLPLNTGVLLYLALDRHHMHIIADRGIAAPDELWQQVCDRLLASFGEKAYASGVLAAIDEIESILRTRSVALPEGELGRASCRERVCQYGWISGVAVY